VIAITSSFLSAWPSVSAGASSLESDIPNSESAADTTTLLEKQSSTGGPAPWPGDYLRTGPDQPETETTTSFFSFITPETTNYLVPEQGSMSVPQQASIYFDPGDSATTAAPDSAPTDGGGLADDGNNSAQLAGDYLSTGDGTTKTPEAGRVGRPFSIPATVTDRPLVLATTFPVLHETGPAAENPPSGGPTLSPILVVDSNGQTLAFTPTAPPTGPTGAVLALGNGETFVESVIGGKTFTKAVAPMLTVVNGQTYSALQIAILTVINGQTFTEVAVGVPATSDNLAFQYVYPLAWR
jgi:hypothetical protein